MQVVPFLPEDRLKERGALYSSVGLIFDLHTGYLLQSYCCCDWQKSAKQNDIPHRMQDSQHDGCALAG